MAASAMADKPVCPKANAIINPGNQNVNEATVVTLDGTNSNPKNKVTCKWTSLTDPTIVITNSTSCIATFTAPEVGTNGAAFQFQLVVTETEYGCTDVTDSNTTNINVANVVTNLPPVASATVDPYPYALEGELVTLDGTASYDPDGDTITYTWSQLPGGTQVTLDSSGAIATFTAPNDAYPSGEALTFGLTVSDGYLSSYAEIIVNITWVNDPPVAVISCPVEVDEGEDVTLDGSASHDPDDGIATYAWSQLLGLPNADLKDVDLSAASITFAAPQIGPTYNTMKFGLTVTDNGGLQDSAECDIVVLDITPPTLSLPDPITAEATGPSGAAVSYSASSTDLVDGSVAVSCSPASGSTFPLGTTTVNCSATDAHSNTANGSFTVTVQDTTPPVISGVPSNMTVFATSASGAVVTYTNPTASDLVDGSVAVTCTPTSGSTFAIGSTTVNCSATDSHGNTASASFTVSVKYNWSGFFQPVDNFPVVNVAKAGSAIPVKFSLGGDMGLDIFASGYPRVVSITIVDGNTVESVIDETVNAGGSSLNYNPLANQYIYVWKSDKSWIGKSYQLQVKLKDGTTHVANFRFK